VPRKSKAARNPHAPEPHEQARFLRDLVTRLAVAESAPNGATRLNATIELKHAKWLAHGLRAWQAGGVTLEQALGLDVGRGAPKKPLNPKYAEAWLWALRQPELTWAQIAGKVCWAGRPDDLGAAVQRNNDRLLKVWIARAERATNKK
jgi:hypothetical protein